MNDLQPCPHCGVMLTGTLVDAINDKEQSESCPKGES